MGFGIIVYNYTSEHVFVNANDKQKWDLRDEMLVHYKQMSFHEKQMTDPFRIWLPEQWADVLEKVRL